MHIDTTDSSTALIQAGVQQIAILREDTDEAHIAEHIHGMVAATMDYLSKDASEATLKRAAQWQDWALGVASGAALPAID